MHASLLITDNCLALLPVNSRRLHPKDEYSTAAHPSCVFFYNQEFFLTLSEQLKSRGVAFLVVSECTQ